MSSHDAHSKRYTFLNATPVNLATVFSGVTTDTAEPKEITLHAGRDNADIVEVGFGSAAGDFHVFLEAGKSYTIPGIIPDLVWLKGATDLVIGVGMHRNHTYGR